MSAWILLELAFWFVVAFLALLWLAGRAFGNAAPRGPGLLIVLTLASAAIAYAVVSAGPFDTECTEEAPQGRGRC